MALTYAERCDAVEAEVARFLAVVTDADPATPVPTCPGWNLADLARHHGTTHRWITHLIRVRATDRVWSRDVPLDLPDDVRVMPEWLADSARTSLKVLRATDPDTPVWTHGADRHVRFFARRLLAEAAVHRADAEIALDRRPVIGSVVAEDLIAELYEHVPDFEWAAAIIRTFQESGTPLSENATPGDRLLILYGRT
ncbi:maleylpyruvate isomerase N-terminal domain-containing protein [Streptomyces sp. NPDC086549]|uniref:maleylpyruvate isomerase N-terminal domain-containing protein n=1 Tax=Streptomyces sp. NPDC086549 TaxID=3365752 RepID=UPI0038014CB2